ncbi:MAG TPA: hypothetical protein VKW06_06300 [Candidatus Angelobacter sp.]|nr:hypothetical protein [Candidatus Angelobacter sp.]
MGNLLSKNADVINKLQSHFGSCTPSTDARCQALNKHLARAQNAQTRASNAHGHTSANNYNQLTLAPSYNRNSNRHGGNGGGGTPPDTVDTNYDTTGSGSVGQTISDQLDDANSALDDASSNLASTPTTEIVPPFHPAEVYDFRNDDAFPAWLHPHLDEHVWIPALFSIKLASNALEFVDQAAEKPCNEVLVVLGEGGDVPIACLPLALANAALKATVEMMEFADADLLYWNAKGGYINAQNAVDVGNQTGAIVEQAAGDTAEIRAKVDAIALYIDTTLTPDLNLINHKLDVLQQTVLTNQALLKETLKMLLLPDGRKALDPTITTCVGTGCPDPLPQCASGVCSFPLK